mgnify:FL=1
MSVMQMIFRHFFYFSNILSFMRIILMIPVIICFENRIFTLGIILSVLVIATDFFDGYFARKLKQVSDMGKFLDPLADKIALGVMVVYLALKNLTPLWFVIILLTRDVLVFIFGIIISRKQKTVVQSNIWGKLCTTVLSLYFLLCIVNILVDLKIVLLIFLTLSLIFLTISTVSYLLPYIKKKT